MLDGNATSCEKIFYYWGMGPLKCDCSLIRNEAYKEVIENRLLNNSISSIKNNPMPKIIIRTKNIFIMI